MPSLRLSLAGIGSLRLSVTAKTDLCSYAFNINYENRCDDGCAANGTWVVIHR